MQEFKSNKDNLQEAQQLRMHWLAATCRPEQLPASVVACKACVSDGSHRGCHVVERIFSDEEVCVPDDDFVVDGEVTQFFLGKNMTDAITPGCEYEVYVERQLGGDNLPLGLSFVDAPECPGIVSGRDEGILSKTAIRRYDRLVAVNSMRGDYAKIFNVLQGSESELRLKLLRPLRFVVLITQDIFSNLSFAPKRSDILLMVSEVNGDATPEFQANDAIVEINGQPDESEKMLDALRSTAESFVTVMRFSYRL